MNDTDRAIAEIRAALDLVPARSWWSVPFGDHAKYIEACSPPNLRALLARLDERDAEVERLRGELNDCINALPGTAYYLDPPDGGSVTIAEQLRRMGEDAARYRWLRGGRDVVPVPSMRWSRWEVRHWTGEAWDTVFTEALDAAIDAARGKE